MGQWTVKWSIYTHVIQTHRCNFYEKHDHTQCLSLLVSSLMSRHKCTQPDTHTPQIPHPQVFIHSWDTTGKSQSTVSCTTPTQEFSPATRTHHSLAYITGLMSSQTALNRINRAIRETVKQKQKKNETQENKMNRSKRKLINTEKELTLCRLLLLNDSIMKGSKASCSRITKTKGEKEKWTNTHKPHIRLSQLCRDSPIQSLSRG